MQHSIAGTNRMVVRLSLFPKPKPAVMKQASLITAILICVTIHTVVQAQKDTSNFSENNITEREVASAKNQKHLNFFIISARKKGKLDPGTRFDILRGKIKSFFRRKRFVAIVAKDMQQAAGSIRYRSQKHKASIGTLWFDSHGTYQKGYSVFRIGRDELNYQSIKDSAGVKPLLDLAAYTDERSKIVIGSCYGGATFLRKSVHSNDTIRMNGDSLMKGLGKIFNRSTIYASESWVMTKPGLFHKKAAVAGYPREKCYKDIVYRPAWENMSKWNEYNAATESFCTVNPVAMDADGNMMVLSDNATDKDKTKKKIEKNLKKLRPGLLLGKR